MARMRTGRILAQDGQVARDPHFPIRLDLRGPPQGMAAGVRGAVVLETLAIEIAAYTRFPRCSGRDHEIGPGAARAKAAAVRAEVVSHCCGRAVHHVDDADERRRAIRDRRRSAKNLDAFDVAQAQGCERGIERAAPRDTVDDEEERVEFTETPELRDGAGRTGVAPRGDGHAGGKRQRILQRRHATCPQIVAADDLDGGGHVVRRLGNSCGDDFDRRDPDGRFWWRSLRGALRRARGEAQTANENARQECAFTQHDDGSSQAWRRDAPRTARPPALRCRGRSHHEYFMNGQPTCRPTGWQAARRRTDHEGIATMEQRRSPALQRVDTTYDLLYLRGMKRIAAAKFKAQCLAILDHLDAEGIVVTKHGKPVAKVLPIQRTSADLIGGLRGRITVVGDIMSTGVKWNAGD